MDYEKYKLKHNYPSKPVKPLLKQGATSVEYREYADLLERWEEECKSYKIVCDNLKQQENVLNEQFKQDLFKDLGIENNPKREKLWEKAYDQGRSHGLPEIYVCACDLVDLIN